MGQFVPEGCEEPVVGIEPLEVRHCDDIRRGPVQSLVVSPADGRRVGHILKRAANVLRVLGRGCGLQFFRFRHGDAYDLAGVENDILASDDTFVLFGGAVVVRFLRQGGTESGSRWG